MSPRRLLVSMLIAVAGLAVFAATASAAGERVGPNQRFAGVVNGSAGDATVYVVCPGPTFPGQRGHPVAGQGVQVIENTGSGFTGSAATRIVVRFGANSASTAVLVFTQYGVPQDIPTSLLLPCAGTDTAFFTPAPSSPTARDSTVTLHFVNIAV